VSTPLPSLAARRSDVGDRLLAELAALVERHGDRAASGTDSELILAEVAHHLAVARSALLRTPRLVHPAA
jgi:hypothetical protein